jgi:PAS domain S-box-containing protein
MGISNLFDQFYNAVLLIALILLVHTAGVKKADRGKSGDLLLGIITGLNCLLVMAKPWELVPGILFDIRSILLSLSGLFFGPLPTVVAGLIAICFRIYLGGTGDGAGVILILNAAALGLVWRRFRTNRTRPPDWGELFLFGFTVHLVILGWGLVVHLQTMYQNLSQTAPVVLILFPLGTAMLGKVLSNQEERRRMEETLRENEDRYRRLFETNYAAMLLSSLEDDAIVDANPAACAFYGWDRETLKRMKLTDMSALPAADIANLKKRLLSEGRLHYKTLHRLADGSRRDVEVFGASLQMEEKHLINYILFDISEKERAERALRESEGRYRQYIEHAPCGVFVLNGRGEVLEINDAACQLCGCARKELLKMAVADFSPAEDPDSAWPYFAELVRAGYFSGTFHHTWRGNPAAWWSVNGIRVGEDRFLVFVIDLTEEKRMESLVRKREQQLSRAQRIAHLGSWEADLQKGLFYPSVEACRIFGLEEKTWSTEEIKRLNLTENREGLFPKIQELTQGGLLFDLEHPLRRAADGELRFVHSIGEYDPDQQLLTGTVQDITERKRIEAALQEWETTLDSILRAAPAAIALLREARLNWVNPTLLDMTGYTQKELIGKSIRMLCPSDEEFEQTKEILREAVAQDKIGEAEARWLRKDGTLLAVLIRLAPLAPGDPSQGTICSAIDISERRVMQEIIVQTEKLMSLGGLAAGMAHEINNPLSVILHGVQNVERRIREPLPSNLEASRQCGIPFEAITAYLEKRNVFRSLEAVREAAAKAARIVENMLTFSRKNEPLPAPQDLNWIVEKAIALARTDFDLKNRYDFRNIALHTEFYPLPRIPCVETELEQVLLNLLRNAGQSLHEAGREEPLIRVRTRQEGPWAIIEVEDNGTGIPPEVRKRIFDPFFTTKRVGEGTGLGLSVSFHIVVQRHHGEMLVESEPGMWTRFIIRLPLGEEKNQQPCFFP